MKKQVSLEVLYGSRPDLLVKASSFEEYLWENLKIWDERTDENYLVEIWKKSKPLTKDVIDILNRATSNSSHPEDILNKIFQEEISLPYDFAKEVNRLDIIDPKCFTSETEEGKALIILLKRSQLIFVVESKTWVTTNKIEISFGVADSECRYDLFSVMVKGNLIEEEETEVSWSREDMLLNQINKLPPESPIRKIRMKQLEQLRNDNT